MQRLSTILTAAVAATAFALAAPAVAQVPLTTEHADIGIAFEDGAWDLHIHDEDNDVEYEPDEAYFLGAYDAPSPRPAGSDFDFIGVGAGEDFFIMPSSALASSNLGVPFIGWATEEIEANVFDGNIAIDLVDVRGPGEFSVWNEAGGAIPLFATSDGIDNSDTLVLPQGTHEHYNIGFTALGTYEVDLVASGELLAGGTSTSDVATYTFVVVPEPASAALLGLGGLGLVRRRR